MGEWESWRVGELESWRMGELESGRVGGKTGWYYANFLWKIRGFLDKLIGGVGLRRGTEKQEIGLIAQEFPAFRFDAF